LRAQDPSVLVENAMNVLKHDIHRLKYELNKLKLTSHIALEDHEIFEKRRNVDIVSAAEIARIREETASLHDQIDSINHDLHRIKHNMYKVIAHGNFVPGNELRGEIAELRSEVGSLKTRGDSDRREIIHNIHCMKYELNKLKLTNHIALEDHEILEKRNVDIISSDEIARTREGTSSLHAQIDSINHDIHRIKHNMYKLISHGDFARDVRCLKHEVRLLKSARSVPADELDREVAKLCSEVASLKTRGDSDMDEIIHDIHCMKYELNKLKLRRSRLSRKVRADHLFEVPE
jgi:hypothetical protein